MRLALLTYEAFAGAAAARRFVAAHAHEIVLVGLSQVHRPSEGGPVAQTLKHLRRSGLGIVPYLWANFTLPALSFGPFRRRARRLGVEGRPLAETCADLGLPVLRVSDVNDEAFRRRLAESGAELIVALHFDQLLDAATIAAVPGGAINLHPALLPAHRGPVPTLHALMEDEPRFGITVHRIVPAIDAGPILAQAAVDLPAGVTAVEAARHLHLAALPLLDQVLDAIGRGHAEERSFSPLPYCGWPSRDQMRRLARLGRKAADWRDYLAALGTPT